MDTQWYDIPGYEGKYQINKLGEVKALAKQVPTPCGGGVRNWEEHIVAPLIDRRGAKRVHLFGVKPKIYTVSRLMVLVFIGDTKARTTHLNGNNGDNRLENIGFTKGDTNVKGYTPAKYGDNQYQSQKTINGIKYYLGLYPTKEEAAWVYFNTTEEMLRAGKVACITGGVKDKPCVDAIRLGFTRLKKLGKFLVVKYFDGERHFLGRYTSEQEAKWVYDNTTLGMLKEGRVARLGGGEQNIPKTPEPKGYIRLKNGKFLVTKRIQGKRYQLGRYITEEEANWVYKHTTLEMIKKGERADKKLHEINKTLHMKDYTKLTKKQYDAGKTKGKIRVFVPELKMEIYIKPGQSKEEAIEKYKQLYK